jgi:RND superfamily putative drug exporter
MNNAFASAVVSARVLVVAGWLALAALMVFTVPSLTDAQTGALGQLIPANSRAIEAEELSAARFAFPLASRTVVVERDPAGLPAGRVGATARAIVRVNRNLIPHVHAEGAYGITNAIAGLPFARERSTTNLSYLLYVPQFSQALRVRGAEAYIRGLDAPPSVFVGITGAIPARAEQADLIAERLPLIELVTVCIIVLAVALYLRSPLAPLVALLTVAVAYLVSVRLVALLGQWLEISVAPEVEPIMVALLFGVVTDYGLFYMSRFRSRVRRGVESKTAARETAQELTPLILACGVAVAAGAMALAVADLGFLRAFGPGMALAVLVGLMVTITFMPALMALLGRALLWPSSQRAPAPPVVRTGRLDRLIETAVHAPRRTVLVSLLALAAMSSGLLWINIGNPLIRGLPADSEPRQAYEQLSAGFAPGAVSPATLVVSAPGIVGDRARLSAFQQILGDQPGVAGVIGPATSPAEQAYGLVSSPSGDAVRFILITEDDPLSASAVRLLRNLDERTDDLLEAVGLPQARAIYAGDTAITGELIDTAAGDLWRVGPLALLAVALVLAVFLRAIVAPAYLVLLAALGPLGALGLAVAFFQGVLGHPEITYFVPLAAGVLLVALGSDYNIFLVGRIWDAAERLPLREAIIAAGSGASHAISAAGWVLSASFAALALVPVEAFHQLAFVLAAGLLIDAFIVRTVLTPAVMSLVGERSSWPSRRLNTPQRTRVPGPERDPSTAPGPRPGDAASPPRPVVVGSFAVATANGRPQGRRVALAVIAALGLVLAWARGRRSCATTARARQHPPQRRVQHFGSPTNLRSRPWRRAGRRG